MPAVVLMLFYSLHGLDLSHSADFFPRSASEYKENKKLSAFLEAEGVKLALPADEVEDYYLLTRKGTELFFRNEDLPANDAADPVRMAPAQKGFYFAVAEDGRLRRLGKVIGCVDPVPNDEEVIKAFTKKYGKPVTMDRQEHFEIHYLLKHQGRYLEFVLVAGNASPPSCQLKFLIDDQTANVLATHKMTIKF